MAKDLSINTYILFHSSLFFFPMLGTKYTKTLVYLICSAVVLFEWHSHCILLWDCDVPLHVAQRNLEFKNYYQVCDLRSNSGHLNLFVICRKVNLSYT